MYLVGVEVFSWRCYDLSHEGAVLNVLALAENVHRVLAGFCGPVPHVARPIAFIVALDLGRRWSLHREACEVDGWWFTQRVTERGRKCERESVRQKVETNLRNQSDMKHAYLVTSYYWKLLCLF